MKDNYGDDFRKITVKKGENGLEVDNPTSLPLIGKGVQGAVFKLSRRRCVKIFSGMNATKKEADAMMEGQDSYLMPKIFDVGDNYIVMEYIDGPSLEDIMQKGEITERLVRRLLEMLDELKRLKFTRLDVIPRHVIFSRKGRRMRIIDHSNSYIKESPYPKRLLQRFKRLNLLDEFLDHVKNIDSKVYDEWKTGLPQYFTHRD